MAQSSECRTKTNNSISVSASAIIYVNKEEFNYAYVCMSVQSYGKPDHL